MAEPTSNYSFYDLILRVAKAAGIAYYGAAGDERALIPIDEHDLIRCKDVVNQGIKTFIADAPPTGWRWMRRIAKVTFATVQTEGTVDSGDATSLIDLTLANTYDTNDEIVGYYVYDQTQEIYGVCSAYDASTGDITISGTSWLDYNGDASSLTPTAGDSFSITNLQTVNGDKRRYPLSQDFMGNVTGKITYDRNSGRGHIIDWDSEASVRFQGEVTVTTGHPTRAAVRPWGSRRWELIVDPSPTAADIVIFPYELGFDELRLEAGDINTPAADSITDDSIGALWPDDYFNGWTVYIMGGRGRGNYAEVDDYTGASGKFDIVDNKWIAPDGLSTGTTPNSESTYYVEPVNNKHPAGLQFDTAVLSACLMEAELEFGTLQIDYSPSEKYMKKDLPAAYRTDARSAPRKLGFMQPGLRRVVRERTWKDVEYE